MTDVFSLPHNWRVPYRERWSYLTDIHRAFDDTEQRVWNRIIPTRSDRYQVTSIGAAASGILDALTFGGQLTQWAVPYWPHATALLAPAAAGASVVLSVDTTDRAFRVGDYVVLWGEGPIAEASLITAKTGGSVTAAALSRSWPAGLTTVLPARLARWAEGITMSRPSLEDTEAPVAFDYELGADPDVAIPAEAEIFSVVDLNRREVPSDQLAWSTDRISSLTSTFQDFARGATPIGRRRFVLLTLRSRAEVASLLEWYHGLRGALTAFWFPTWQADLTLAGAPVGAEITIMATGYTTRLFPHLRRRHLGFIPPAGAIVHRTVLASVDNGNGTETLTLDAAPPAGASLISFLLYVRLTEDELELAWEDTETAEATLDLTEIGAEL